MNRYIPVIIKDYTIHIYTFTRYQNPLQVIGQPTSRKKRQMSEKLKLELNENTMKEEIIFIYVAHIDEHTNHLTGEVIIFYTTQSGRAICYTVDHIQIRN